MSDGFAPLRAVISVNWKVKQRWSSVTTAGQVKNCWLAGRRANMRAAIGRRLDKVYSHASCSAGLVVRAGVDRLRSAAGEQYGQGAVLPPAEFTTSLLRDSARRPVLIPWCYCTTSRRGSDSGICRGLPGKYLSENA